MKFPIIPAEYANSATISFEFADLNPFDLDYERLSTWLNEVATSYQFSIRRLSYIFCTDTWLHAMNVDYLDHDTLTDIITFDLSDASDSSSIEGECYISYDRILDNSQLRSLTLDLELRRVVVHGLLHLCGFDDKDDLSKLSMRAAENSALMRYRSER